MKKTFLVLLKLVNQSKKNCKKILKLINLLKV